MRRRPFHSVARFLARLQASPAEEAQQPDAVIEQTPDTFAINAKLVEYEIHTGEIRARSDFQNRILQIYVTTLAIIVGALITRAAPPDIVLFIPLLSSITGMWYFDHALAIEGAGTYIATDIEQYLGPVAADRPGFMRWESAHMVNEITWPPPRTWRSWGFSEVIQATFLLPIVFALGFSFVLWVYRLAEPLPGCVYCQVAQWRGDPGDLIPFLIQSAWAYADNALLLFWLAIEVPIWLISWFTWYQFMILALHWRCQQESRQERIAETIVYRFYRASYDPFWKRRIEEFASPAYHFLDSGPRAPQPLDGWMRIARQASQQTGFRATFRKTRGTRPVSDYCADENLPDDDGMVRKGWLLVGQTTRFLKVLLRSTGRPPASPEGISNASVPPREMTMAIEVCIAGQDRRGAAKPEERFEDTLTIIDGLVSRHERRLAP